MNMIFYCFIPHPGMQLSDVQHQLSFMTVICSHTRAEAKYAVWPIEL